MKYVNTDASRRVWPNIQLPDGSTLELDPGEEVELKGRIKDPFLNRTKLTKKEQEEQDKADAAAAADDDAADNDTEEQK